jgi:hypothetical protein
MGPLIVVILHKALKLILLLEHIARRRPCSGLLEHAVHALMSSILLRVTWLYEKKSRSGKRMAI